MAIHVQRSSLLPCRRGPTVQVRCFTTQRAAQGRVAVRASNSENSQALDFKAVADFIALQAIDDDEQRFKLETLAEALDLPVTTVKQMAYKKKPLLAMEPAEVKLKIQHIAEVVEVPYPTALEMVVIQPGLLIDVERQAETLALGIKAICYELNAPKDEVLQLILRNHSVLHGRDMHLSVADIAHLAVIREPKSRIMD